MPTSLSTVWAALFAGLRASGYAWEAPAPDQLRRLRQDRAELAPLARVFGLGLDVSDAEMIQAGLPAAILPELRARAPAVSRLGDDFVVHDRWGRAAGGEFVYLGPESFTLARLLGERSGLLRDRRVLDLGSGAGALSFTVARLGAARVRGLETSARAVEWATASAEAQSIANASFVRARIGTSEAEETGDWDAVVFNPPMAVSVAGSSRPERDGGPTGAELPLQFLDFAARKLVRGGDAFFLATNPIIAGRPVFFDRLRAESGPAWEMIERRRLHAFFNRSLHRQDGYARRGIERIELWFVHLRKR